MTHPGKYADYATELVVVASFVRIRDKYKNPQKVVSNPSAFEDFNDGADKWSGGDPFEQLIMAEQCKVINA